MLISFMFLICKKYVDCFFPFVDLSCNGFVFTLLSTIGLKLIYVYYYVKKKK